MASGSLVDDAARWRRVAGKLGGQSGMGSDGEERRVTRLLGRYAVSATLAGVIVCCTLGARPIRNPPRQQRPLGWCRRRRPRACRRPRRVPHPQASPTPRPPRRSSGQHTEGACAFVRYFPQSNEPSASCLPWALSPLSTSACESSAYEAEFADLVSEHQHLDRGPHVLTEVVVVPDAGPGAALSVDAVTQQQAVKIVDSHGGVQGLIWTAKIGVFVLDLVRENDWKLERDPGPRMKRALHR